MINSFTGDYYFLSNFYMAPVSYNGWDYTNNEAAFQAQKTKNRRLRFQLFSKASPSGAKATGRKIDLEKLLATGDEHLEEGNTWGDTTWGTVNGIGENRLGRILMKVRKELQEESK